MVFFPAPEYRPDVAGLNAAYSDDVLGVLPFEGGYIPCPTLSVVSEAIPYFPRGSISVRGSDGQVFFFTGSNTYLYKLDNVTLSWVNVSRQTGGDYNASDENHWSFAVFGNKVIAVNANDDPQVFDIGTSSHFTKLGGNPPRAGVVRVWGDFVCLMGLVDHPNRVHWSGLNDPEWWTAGQKSCDWQDFPDGGWVQGSSEATNPLVFSQSAIYLATFVPGSDIIFSFQKIQDKQGAKSVKSIVSRGHLSFFISEGSFNQITAAGEITDIGWEKVNRTVFSRFSSEEIARMKGVVDPFQSRVYWFFPTRDHEGVFGGAYVYDWILARWTRIEQVVLDAFPIFASGYTLEGLDSVSASVENLAFSLDSKVWQGGAPALAGFSYGGRLGYFQGENMGAAINFGEFGVNDGQVQMMRRIMPSVDSENCQARVGARLRRFDKEPLTWTGWLPSSYATGAIHRRSRSRFHKFIVGMPAGDMWTQFKGIDVDFQPAGWR